MRVLIHTIYVAYCRCFSQVKNSEIVVVQTKIGWAWVLGAILLLSLGIERVIAQAGPTTHPHSLPPAALVITSTPTATPVITPTQLVRPFPKLLAEIPLAPPEAHLTDLLLDTPARRLYVTDSTGQLHILDSSDYAELAVLPAAGQLTLDAPRQRLLVSSPEGKDPLTLVDTVLLTITAVISPGGGVAVDEGRQRLYVGQRDLVTTSLRIYDLTSLAPAGQINQSGLPVYNSRRDELYLVYLNVTLINPETLTVTGKLLPTLAAETYGFRNETIVPADVRLLPEENLLLVDMRNISVGKGPGLLASARFFRLDSLQEVTDPPIELEYGCFGQLIVAEPVGGHILREQFYSRYQFAANLKIYDLTGKLTTWYDGLYLGRTNPRTQQMYFDSQVFDLLPLSPLGRLPAPTCIDTLEPESGRLFGVWDNTLRVFSEAGGIPLSPPPQPITTVPVDFSIWDIIFSPDYQQDQTVFLTGEKIYRSQDGGQHWVQLQGGLPAEATFDLTLSPTFAADRMGWVQPRPANGLGAGIYRSPDAGDTWQPVWTGLTHLRVVDLILSPDFTQDGTLWATSRYMALPNTDEAVSTFTSTDAGLNWSLVTTRSTESSEIVPPWPTPAPVRLRWTQTEVTSPVEAIIERSLDGGQNWTTTLTLPPEASGSTDLIFIGSSPSLAADELVLLTADPYLYRSTDLGASWHQVLSTTGGLKAIVFSPAFSQTGVVYAYSDAEIWRSQDRGQNWRLVLSLTSGESYYDPLSLVFAPAGRAVFAFNYGGMWRSEDEGQNWRNVFTLERPQSYISIEAVFFSPAYPTDQTLYIVSDHALFRSTDGGTNWSQVLSLIQPETVALTEPLRFSPRFSADHTLYLLGQVSLFRSTDGGQYWQQWQDDRLPTTDYRLEKVAISPALANGGHQLFIETAQYQPTSSYQLWILNPADMNWE